MFRQAAFLHPAVAPTTADAFPDTFAGFSIPVPFGLQVAKGLAGLDRFDFFAHHTFLPCVYYNILFRGFYW